MIDQQVVDSLGQLTDQELSRVLSRCCSSTAWVDRVVAQRPYADGIDLHVAADRAFNALSEPDWLEAFAGHPKIGDIDQLRIKFGGDKLWSKTEQSQIARADERTLASLVQQNGAYERKFGFIFIVCATGKSAEQMCDLLNTRLGNDRQTEIGNASAEQRKITHLRIDKLQPDFALS
ncbi:MAG TPA: 2-oxo-4-hydroxy-4-carboxy-5-ureidoimidazoline decarboxylase [Planctomycetaceae bacterium]|nr:2-oxo-4-hydroxy-4-carboxy-5-ureidoimidazoline decarboxylase [Planctomycetaceae bacterium]